MTEKFGHPDSQKFCGLCRRPLEVASDPLSLSCGGDCWGCVGEIEYDAGGGFPETDVKVREEIAAGLRNPDGTAKPPPRSEATTA